jgi:Sulfotransferase domain
LGETTPQSQNRNLTTPAGLGPEVRRSRLRRFQQEFPSFVKKNRGLLARPAFWAMLARLAAARLRPMPLGAGARAKVRVKAGARAEPVMFVATHHKVMTTYFTAVLRLLSFGVNRRYQRVFSDPPEPGARLVLAAHGKLDLPALCPSYRGVHIMRDPRDMIVSGYHYHKWTYEDWVHRPDEAGVSYQQKLNRTDRRAGLFMEIEHFIFFYRETLERWDVEDPDILEVSYEDLMSEQRSQLYRDMFGHLGFDGRDLDLGCDLMRLFEAGSRTGRKTGVGSGRGAAGAAGGGIAVVAKNNHLRSGRSGQWRDELEAEHLDYIERELGPVLRKFGY